MADYYVEPAPAGNDANPGTLGSPWATWQHAADTAVAGDTIYFKDGTYGSWASVDIDTNDGTGVNPIVFRALNPGNAIINFDATGVSKVTIEVDYIEILDLIIDGGQANATALCRIRNAAHNVTFQDCTLRDTDSRGIYITGGSYNVTIDGCDINTNSTAGNAYDGIAIVDGYNVNVDGCTIYETDHVGVFMESSNVHDVTVENCTIYKCGSHGVTIRDDAHDIIVRDNIIHGDAGGWDDEPNGMAIGIRVEGAGADVEIYRNQIYHTGKSGFRIEGDTAGPLNFYNNTLYNLSLDGGTADNGAIKLESLTAVPEPIIRIKNNAVDHTDGTARIFHSDNANNIANLDVDYNDWYAEGGSNNDMRFDGTTYGSPAAYFAAGYEPNSISADPTFTDKANADFSLAGGSPCIDDGVNVGLPFQGTAPDMGAIESSAAPVAGVVIIYIVLTNTAVVS